MKLQSNLALIVILAVPASWAQVHRESANGDEVQARRGTLQAGGSTERKVPQIPLLGSAIRTIRGVYQPEKVQDGEKLPAVCVFTFSLRRDETALQANARSAVRVNPDGGCEADFEVGQPPRELIDWAASLRERPLESQTVRTESKEQDSEQAIEASNSERLLDYGPPGFTQSAGYQTSWFVDPVGIVVNSVYTQTTWWWYAPDTCVVPQSGQYQRTWFSPSGWSLGYENWINGATCSYTASYATNIFVNNGFPLCFGGTVYAYYWPAAVWGGWDGTLTGQFAWSLTGPSCINLLTPQFQLVRTL